VGKNRERKSGVNIAVFASGNGSNFEAIAQAVKKRKIRANLALLVSDNPTAFVLKRARKYKIRIAIVRREDFFTKKDFEAGILSCLKVHGIDLIVLAGFMRVLSPEFVRRYRNKILNIHPSLLPAFKGAHGIRDAFDYGVKVSGVTVHFVDEQMDHGPIVLQEPLVIEERDTLAELEARIHKVEHCIYPEAIKLFTERKLKAGKRKVKILFR